MKKILIPAARDSVAKELRQAQSRDAGVPVSKCGGAFHIEL